MTNLKTRILEKKASLADLGQRLSMCAGQQQQLQQQGQMIEREIVKIQGQLEMLTDDLKEAEKPEAVEARISGNGENVG